MATHLIGGEMTYTYLGNNEYEISLTVYVDCGPTNVNGVGLDDDIIITVYNPADNSEVASIFVDYFVETLLDNETVGNDCLELPTELCIKQGVYTDTVTLPPSEDGYILAYQRCCRNPSIINIETPEDFGSTFTTNIPGTNTVEDDYNSSPIFNSYPPLALCVGDEINVDLSATDSDGDSLAYELTTPFHGANTTNPYQITPPPFTPIPWETGYSANYPMDANPAISIDPSTGFITGTPAFMGMFIIGVKVNEYRNGVLISSVIRDFRFLVVDCNVTTSSIPNFEWYCSGYNVQFTNNSVNANTYLWDFGDNGASSTAFAPTYTYPADGNYTVTLIANPNTACADTNSINLPVYTTLDPAFTSPAPQCIDNNSFSFSAAGLIPNGATFSWNFGPNASPATSSLQNPSGISFSTVGTHQVSYTILYDECDETYTGDIEVFDENIQPVIPYQNTQCLENNSFNFSAAGIYPNNATFAWNFGPNATPTTSSYSTVNGVQFSTDGTQAISLTISSNGCSEQTVGSIDIFEEPDLEIINSEPIGCETHEVIFSTNIEDSTLYSFQWDLGNGTLATSNTCTTTYAEGLYDISVSVTNSENTCSTSINYDDYITAVAVPESDFSILTDDPQCLSDNNFSYSINTPQALPTYITWDFGQSASPSTSNSNSPQNINYTEDGEMEVICIANTLGCTDTTIKTITIHPAVEIELLTPVIHGCAPLDVTFSTNLDSLDYEFYWDFGNNTSSTNPSENMSYPVGSYDISIQATNVNTQCDAEVLYPDHVNVITQPIAGFSTSQDSMVFGDLIYINNLSEHATELEYVFSSGYTTHEWEPTYTFPSVGMHTITQYATNEYACIDTASVDVYTFLEYNIWVPNVFTPDGDQLNDIFKPVCHNIESYRLQIYSRWGEQLFNQEGESPYWSGVNIDGSLCKQDTYVYYIEYFTPEKKFGRIEGFVILLR